MDSVSDGIDKDFKFPRETLLVDFDGTLGPFSFPALPAKPFEGAAEALRELKSLGFRILIFTTRAWPGWKKIDGSKFYWEKLQDVKDFCQKWDIPYDGITHEKVPCMFIIDDRALNPGLHGWNRILEIVKESAKSDSYGKIRGVEDAKE